MIKKHYLGQNPTRNSLSTRHSRLDLEGTVVNSDVQALVNRNNSQTFVDSVPPSNLRPENHQRGGHNDRDCHRQRMQFEATAHCLQSTSRHRFGNQRPHSSSRVADRIRRQCHRFRRQCHKCPDRCNQVAAKLCSPSRNAEQ